MPVKTTLEQLEECQSAISETLTSQELKGANGGVVRARLDYLEKREENLLARYNREQALSKNVGPATVHGIYGGQ